MKLVNLVQNTPEWLEWRQKGIGASEMAAILGVCKYSTPYRVWCEKTGRTKGFAGNFATERGHDLEAKARARYELVSMEDMPTACAEHVKYSILRCSLDGIREDYKKILEIKCPGKESHEIAASGKVPDHYFPQVQFQLMVTGADECEYFSYYVNKEGIETHAIVNVKPDLEYQGMLVVKALEFWKLVESNTRPVLMDDDDLLVEDGEVAELCKKLAQKDSLQKAEVDRLKETVVRLGGHSRIRSGRVLVTRSRTSAGKDSYRVTLAKEAAGA